MASVNHSVWRKHPGLVWSNRKADDTVRIRAALVRPRFNLLLDLALVFGLERLRREWDQLENDDTAEVRRAKPVIERVFRNLEEGFRHADSGN